MIRKLFIYLFISSIALSTNAAEIDTITLTSNAMHKSIKSIIIKPNTYGLNKERYSVLYLLHGAGGDYTKDPSNPLIRDLIIEGLSLARTQKEEFSSIIQGNDGDINALFVILEEFIN